MLNPPDEKGMQLVAANIVAGQSTERYFEKIVTFAQTNEKDFRGTNESSYFLHEFRSKVLRLLDSSDVESSSGNCDDQLTGGKPLINFFAEKERM